MKIRKRWLHHIQWANVAILAAGALNGATGAVPALQENKTVLMLQAIAAALLPSLGGLANKVSTPEEK